MSENEVAFLYGVVAGLGPLIGFVLFILADFLEP